MNTVMTAVKRTLDNDDTLLSLLGSNIHFKKGGSANKRNSILPAGFLNTMKNFPVITTDQGQLSRNGTFLYNELFYIRVYNELSATTVKMNDILNRVKKLIDKQDLAMDTEEALGVELRWEGRLQPIVDEQFGVRFIEDTYRIYLL